MYRQSELLARVMGASDEAIARSREQQQRLFAIIRQEKDPATAEKKLRESLDLTLSEVKPGERASAEAAVKAQLQTLLTPWFRFFLTYDPAPGLAKLHQPVLAIAGSLDLQVPPDQNLPVIEKMLKAAGNKDFEIVRLPGLNHLFQTAQTGSPMEYARIEETIAPAALETIANWILRHTRTPR